VALVIVLDNSSTEATEISYSIGRLRSFGDVVQVVTTMPPPRPEVRELFGYGYYGYGSVGFLSPREKALERRRGHAAFVGLVGGPAPELRPRVQHSRTRTAAKKDAWRPRALRRYRHSTAPG
jgi:hypothetical protein